MNISPSFTDLVDLWSGLRDLSSIFLQDGFSKSVINKSKPRTNEHLSEEEREKRMKEFVGKYEGEIKAFGWLKKFDDR